MKRKMSFSIMIVYLFMVAFIFFSMTANLNGQTEKALWTFMFYMDGDNNLEKPMMRSINLMELYGVPNDVNVVIQLDRHPNYESANGNWTNIRRYSLRKAKDLDKHKQIVEFREEIAKFASKRKKKLSEANMGKAENLVDFVSWAKKKYPAKYYALILCSHGGGWMGGIIADETSNMAGDGGSFEIPALKRALKKVKGVLKKKISLLVFNACLMGNFAVDEAIAPYVHYRVASEEVSYGLTRTLPYIFEELHRDSAKKPKEMAKTFIQQYQKMLNDFQSRGHFNYYQITTWSATRLSRFKHVRLSVEVLALALISKMTEVEEALALAREQVEKYEFKDYVDLYHLMDILKAHLGRTGSTDLVELCTNVQKALNNYVIANVNGKSRPYARGVSITFFEAGKPHIKDWIYTLKLRSSMRAWPLLQSALIGTARDSDIKEAKDYVSSLLKKAKKKKKKKKKKIRVIIDDTPWKAPAASFARDTKPPKIRVTQYPESLSISQGRFARFIVHVSGNDISKLLFTTAHVEGDAALLLGIVPVEYLSKKSADGIPFHYWKKGRNKVTFLWNKRYLTLAVGRPKGRGFHNIYATVFMEGDVFHVYGSYEFKSTSKIVDAVMIFHGQSKEFVGMYALNNKKGANPRDHQDQASAIEFNDDDLFTPLLSYVSHNSMKYRKFAKLPVQKRYARPIRMFKGIHKKIKLREQTIHQKGDYPIAFTAYDFAGNYAMDSVIIKAER